MSKQTRAWAVMTPEGEIMVQTVALREDSAISAVCSKHSPWAALFDRGYRCVPVTVAQEKGACDAGN